MAKPRVCILTETYYPVVGGGETQARALAEGLSANGFGTVVVTRRSHAALPKTEQFGEVTVHRLPPVGAEHLKKWGLLLTSVPALVNLHRHYDVVFVSGFRVVGLSAVLTSALLGKACVLKADSLGEMSGDFFAGGLAGLGLRRSSLVVKAFLYLRNLVLRRANAFVAVSSEVADELEAHGVNPRVIRRLPNSVDTAKFHPVGEAKKHELRRKLDLIAKDRIVVYTGRLVSYKGLPLLLRVWKEIQRKYGDAGLVLVGSGGRDMHNCEAELKEYVGANGLSGSVQFAGNVGNVPEYLQAADVFVFPTENEAFGISLVEAMACGLPAISTPVGGVKDILEHRHNGLLVGTGDFRQLWDALDTLLADAALRMQLGQVARQTAQDRFSAESVSREYIELFLQMRAAPAARQS